MILARRFVRFRPRRVGGSRPTGRIEFAKDGTEARVDRHQSSSSGLKTNLGNARRARCGD